MVWLGSPGKSAARVCSTTRLSVPAGPTECREKMGLRDLPLGAVLAYMSSWVRLYGTVTMEVFGHLKFATDAGEPLSELTVAEICGLLGSGRT